jgi:hypothetical protein
MVVGTPFVLVNPVSDFGFVFPWQTVPECLRNAPPGPSQAPRQVLARRGRTTER